MLYIKFEDESLNSASLSSSALFELKSDLRCTDRDSQPPLLDELLAQQVDLPPPPTFDTEVKDDGKGKVASTEKGGGEKKIPKWLKVGNSESSRDVRGVG